MSDDRYLEWARANSGRLPYDLTVSGMPHPSRDDLAAPEVDDDPRALGKLVAAVAHYLARPESEVVPALGTAHALWLASASSLRAGDDVLLESPLYQPLGLACTQAGARIVSFERTPAPSFQLEIGRVLAALTPTTRLVSVSNLHNPTGVRTPDRTLAELATELAARGILLHVDEVYAPFDAAAGVRGVTLDAHGRFARSACRLGANVLATGSLTKVYGLGAARIGYVAAAPDLASRVRDLLEITVGALPWRWATFAVHAFARLAAEGGLVERTRRFLGDKRERVAAWMAEQPGILWSAPAEGLFGFAQVEDGAVDVDAWVARGAREEGVLVTPGRFFGAPRGFRLAWSIADDKLDQALERLGRARAS